MKSESMDEMTVWGSGVSGLVQAPSGKSHMIRLLAAGTLCRTPSRLHYSGTCDDVDTALAICRKLGAAVNRSEGMIEIQGPQNLEAGIMDCRESGLCLRMFAPIAALSHSPAEMHASGSLKHRPAGMIGEGLKQLQVRVKTHNGYPPVLINGPVVPGTVTADGSLSSQFLTGLLMALPLAEGNSLVRVESLKSRPYVEMTLQVLKEFGVQIEAVHFREFRIPGNQAYRSPGRIRVEGDWSGAANLLVAGAIAGDVTVKGLNHRSLQADQVVTEILSRAGAPVERPADNTCRVQKRDLTAFTADLDHCPDLAPALIPLALAARGTSVLRSAGRLRMKESDRAGVLVKEYNKLGADVRFRDNALYIKGPALLHGGPVEAHHDHRLVMSLAVASLLSRKAIRIHGWSAVGKSYPRFPEDMQSLGVGVTFNNKKNLKG